VIPQSAAVALAVKLINHVEQLIEYLARLRAEGIQML
jgi:hypothetical protein